LEMASSHHNIAMGDRASNGQETMSSADDSPRLRAEPDEKPPAELHSRTSHDSDPFEALERALTPDLETEAEHAARAPITYTRTGGTSICSAASRPPDFEVVFEQDDPENPKNWPLWYRAWTIFVLSFSTWIVVLYSTSYTASIPGLVTEFGVSTPVATLGVTTYLLGLAVGSLVVAPMSELYGRQKVYLACMVLSTLLIIPCGLADSLAAIVAVRFLGYARLLHCVPHRDGPLSKRIGLYLARPLCQIAPVPLSILVMRSIALWPCRCGPLPP
jgi:MFS transporter